MRNFDKKIFNLPTFMFLWSQSLHISQIHWVFCLIFAGIKTKTSQNSLYSTAFFKILKEPALVQKPIIPHMKALILNFLEPDGQGRGIVMEEPCSIPVKSILSRKSRTWHPQDDATPSFVHWNTKMLSSQDFKTTFKQYITCMKKAQ